MISKKQLKQFEELGFITSEQTNMILAHMEEQYRRKFLYLMQWLLTLAGFWLFFGIIGLFSKSLHIDFFETTLTFIKQVFSIPIVWSRHTFGYQYKDALWGLFTLVLAHSSLLLAWSSFRFKSEKYSDMPITTFPLSRILLTVSYIALFWSLNSFDHMIEEHLLLDLPVMLLFAIAGYGFKDIVAIYFAVAILFGKILTYPSGIEILILLAVSLLFYFLGIYYIKPRYENHQTESVHWYQSLGNAYIKIGLLVGFITLLISSHNGLFLSWFSGDTPHNIDFLDKWATRLACVALSSWSIWYGIHKEASLYLRYGMVFLVSEAIYVLTNMWFAGGILDAVLSLVFGILLVMIWHWLMVCYEKKKKLNITHLSK